MTVQKDARTHRTKQTLVDAMFELLAKEDFQNITVNDVCAIASVSRTTFYLYFEDKYSLVICCIEEIVYAIMQEYDGGNTDRIFDKLLTAVQERRQVLQNLLKYEGSRELQHRLDAFFVQQIEQFLAKRTHGLPCDPPLSILAVFYAAGMSDLILWWLSGGFSVSRKQMVQYLSKIFDMKIPDAIF